MVIFQHEETELEFLNLQILISYFKQANARVVIVDRSQRWCDVLN